MTRAIYIIVGTGALAVISGLGFCSYWQCFEAADFVEPVRPVSVAEKEYVHKARGADEIDIAPIDVELELEELLEGELEKVKLDMAFASQAPFGDWGYPYQEACEEASAIMVEYYLTGEFLDAAVMDKEILAMWNWEKENGYEQDVDLDELSEIIKGYFGRDSDILSGDEVNLQSLKDLLADGYPVIVPAAGQHLGNPNFTGDGPEYHMLVLRGYDSKYFYTNDPGTRNGEDYRYKHDVLLNAIHDWTGDKSTITSGRRAVLVVR